VNGVMAEASNLHETLSGLGGTIVGLRWMSDMNQ
jgi:hypothetical protein